MEDWLRKYKLHHLWPGFKEQGLHDVRLLRCLDDSDIKEVAKSIGDQIRLKRAIFPHAAQEKKEEPPTKKKVGMNVDPVRVVFARPLMIKHPTTETQLIVSQPNAGISASGSQINEKTTSAIQATPPPKPSTIQNHFVSFSTQEVIKAQFNLENVFKNDVLAATLMQKSKTQMLTNGERDKICDITVRYAMNITRKLDYDTIDDLANQIEKLFKNESKSTYYIPAIKKSQSSKRKSERARGKLVDKYRNRLHLLRTLEAADNKDLQDSSRSETDHEDDTNSGNEIRDLDALMGDNDLIDVYIKTEVTDCDDDFEEHNNIMLEEVMSLCRQDDEVPPLRHFSDDEKLSADQSKVLDVESRSDAAQTHSINTIDVQQAGVTNESKNIKDEQQSVPDKPMRNDFVDGSKSAESETSRHVKQLEEIVKLQRQLLEHEIGIKSSDPMCNSQFLLSLVPFMSKLPLNMNVEFRTQLMELIEKFLNRSPIC